MRLNRAVRVIVVAGMAVAGLGTWGGPRRAVAEGRVTCEDGDPQKRCCSRWKVNVLTDGTVSGAHFEDDYARLIVWIEKEQKSDRDLCRFFRGNDCRRSYSAPFCASDTTAGFEEQRRQQEAAREEAERRLEEQQQARQAQLAEARRQADERIADLRRQSDARQVAIQRRRQAIVDDLNRRQAAIQGAADAIVQGLGVVGQMIQQELEQRRREEELREIRRERREAEEGARRERRAIEEALREAERDAAREIRGASIPDPPPPPSGQRREQAVALAVPPRPAGANPPPPDNSSQSIARDLERTAGDRPAAALGSMIEELERAAGTWPSVPGGPALTDDLDRAAQQFSARTQASSVPGAPEGTGLRASLRAMAAQLGDGARSVGDTVTVSVDELCVRLFDQVGDGERVNPVHAALDAVTERAQGWAMEQWAGVTSRRLLRADLTEEQRRDVEFEDDARWRAGRGLSLTADLDLLEKWVLRPAEEFVGENGR